MEYSTRPQIQHQHHPRFTKSLLCLRKKSVSSITFINLTGQPTRAGRNQVRKVATIARKKEKEEKARKEERRAILEALSIASDEIPSDIKSPTPLEPCTIRSDAYDLLKIPRFGSVRSDPFMKYSFELSHRERQLMDHSKFIKDNNS